jgi:hypothetical protein
MSKKDTMDRAEMVYRLGITSISVISSSALWTNITFLYKTGEDVILTIKDDPYYIGHKDMLEEAINNYLSAELAKLRELKINILLND